jgi:hypothetical protein
MAETIEKDTWVEIYMIILQKGERAPQVPEDTQQVPLEMKVKGFLQHEAELGGQADIITPVGRKFTGRLIGVNPEYTHNFGHPIPELLHIGRELRDILAKRRHA